METLFRPLLDQYDHGIGIVECVLSCVWVVYSCMFSNMCSVFSLSWIDISCGHGSHCLIIQLDTERILFYNNWKENLQNYRCIVPNFMNDWFIYINPRFIYSIDDLLDCREHGGKKTREGVKSGVGRLERIKHGLGIKGRDSLSTLSKI